MKTGSLLRSAASASLALALSGLAFAPSASAQFAGPFGPQQNYVYYGGPGPFGWGPYAFGWGGYSVVGYMPAMPPAQLGPEIRAYALNLSTARPPTTADALRQQADAAAWRDRRREALRMQAKVDVSTGLPRTLPARVEPPMPLRRRIESLFNEDGVIRWPAGLASAAPVARRAAEQAAAIALEQYRLQGRADVTDVTFAREQLGNFAAPVFAQLALLDDPVASQTTVDFLQRLDALLIDLADPPAEPPADPPAEPEAPPPTP